jgi:hypothetical protein
MHSAVFDLFKFFQTNLNLVQSKDDVTMIQNFEIKYGFEDYEVSYNFPY